jgi:hypothetical protein
VLVQDGRGEDFDLEGAVGEVLENDRVAQTLDALDVVRVLT